jgi:hypothetical protein
VFVDTVSQIITSAIINKTISQEPVNFALGTRTSIMQLVAIISELMGTRLEVTYSPARPGDIPHSQADLSRLHALFPSIRSISLKDGLAPTPTRPEHATKICQTSRMQSDARRHVGAELCDEFILHETEASSGDPQIGVYRLTYMPARQQGGSTHSFSMAIGRQLLDRFSERRDSLPE